MHARQGSIINTFVSRSKFWETIQTQLCWCLPAEGQPTLVLVFPSQRAWQGKRRRRVQRIKNRNFIRVAFGGQVNIAFEFHWKIPESRGQGLRKTCYGRVAWWKVVLFKNVRKSDRIPPRELLNKAEKDTKPKVPSLSEKYGRSSLVTGAHFFIAHWPTLPLGATMVSLSLGFKSTHHRPLGTASVFLGSQISSVALPLRL